jgi:1-acyl-sn-glycerol-3-phosphate acyltransferase
MPRTLTGTSPAALALARSERDHYGMLAAAMTLWTMFSVWLIAHCARLPVRIGGIASGLLWLELGLLAIWSYGSEGCDVRTCAPVAQAAGIAARTDVPILAVVYLVGMVVWLTRRGSVDPSATRE